MNISGLSDQGAVSYGVRCEKLAQDQQKREGEQAVALIEASSPTSPGPDGQGTHVDVVA